MLNVRSRFKVAENFWRETVLPASRSWRNLHKQRPKPQPYCSFVAAAIKNGAMAKDHSSVRVHVTIHGRVQGVYFRASTVYQAQNLGLTGWVRNCLDGSVEATAEGTREKLDELIAWCKKGPNGARVTNVEVNWAPAENNFQAFTLCASSEDDRRLMPTCVVLGAVITFLLDDCANPDVCVYSRYRPIGRDRRDLFRSPIS